MIHKVFLTFDTEDFINNRSVEALYRILTLLQKYDLKALFFVTGHMAEKLSNHPHILDLLEFHEVGYHSSSHSVRPTIFEYTDVKGYEEAYETSLQRERSHINPLTGEVEGEGGIEFLRRLFSKKSIASFRAPGLCWSPPHLEALVKLGFEFDFSAYVSSRPVYYREITFYPHPHFYRPSLKRIISIGFLKQIRNELTIVDIHPSSFVNQLSWDSIYYECNPRTLSEVPPRSKEETEFFFRRFDALLKLFKLSQKTGLIEITPHLNSSRMNLTIEKMNIQECYEKSISWPTRFFHYKPNFLSSHFLDYFSATICAE